MGKLHTLRRAIERNPEEFIFKNWRGDISVKGAYFHKGRWHGSYWLSSKYKGYVRFVLKSLGMIN